MCKLSIVDTLLFKLTLCLIFVSLHYGAAQTIKTIVSPSGTAIIYAIPENTVLPETFVFPTKVLGNHLRTVHNCYDGEKTYPEVLGGYEHYLPCWSNQSKVHTFFDLSISSRINLDCPTNFPRHLCATDTTKLLSYVSRNLRNKDQNHIEYFPTSNLEDFSQKFNGLQRIELVNHKIGSLKGLEKLEKLKYLELSVSHIEDWSSISELQQVETLNLACSNITNEDLVHIAKLSSVKTLVLDGTEISDVSALRTMANLQNLLIKVTNIETIEELSVLKPLNLKWVSFHPEWSKPFLERERPDYDAMNFVEGYSISQGNSGVLDNQYPSRNCTYTVFQYGRVW